MGRKYSQEELDQLMKSKHKKIGFFNGLLNIFVYLIRVMLRLLSFKTLAKAEMSNTNTSKKEPENQISHYDK
jgi:hypothetical protein